MAHQKLKEQLEKLGLNKATPPTSEQWQAFLQQVDALFVEVNERTATENVPSEREHFLQMIIDSIPQGIFWKDRQSVYEGGNKYFADAAGMTPKELIGKTDYELPWKKEESDFFVEIDQRVMSSGKAELGVIEPQQQADGTQTWVETNKIPLFNDDNEVIGILGTFKDITERMHLQGRIEQSLAQRSQEVELVTQIAQEIARAADLNDLYQRVVNEVKEQFGYYHTQLLRYDTDLDTVVLIVGYGETGQKMQAMNHSLPLGVGLIGIAAETGQSVLRSDVTQATDWQANPLLSETRSELAVPIKLGDEILGVLDIQSDQVDGISLEEQLVLEGLCGQIAVAIESKRLQQEMESNLRELAALQRYMTREGWADYKNVKKGLKGFAYDQSGVYTIDAIDHEESDVAATAVNGTESPPANKKQSFVKTKLSIRDETFGTIAIQDDPERPLTPEEQALLQAISQQVAEALEAARLFEETQSALSEQERLTSDLETVAQVSTAASTILETDTLLQSVVDLAKSSFGLYHAHVYLVDGQSDALVLRAGAGNVGRLMSLEGRTINISDTALVARAARTRKGILENDVRKTVDFMPHPLLPDTKAEIAQPMVVGNKLIGVLDLQSDKVNAFTEEDLQIHQILASQIAVAVENATQYSEQVEISSKLREVDRLKSEFLASMSHELRTPLNSIIGFADVLLEGLDGELNERMDQDVRLIKDSGTHLRDLIGDILDMSKIEAGRMELRYEKIDLRQMAHDILATANPLAKEKQLALHLNLDDTITTIDADRTRIRQVLWNIMGNAIKFTEKGSVTLGMKLTRDMVRISIQDTGIGIKPEDIGVVFEQFRQVDGSLNRSVGGTGLGMPITKKLVELHGGVIGVDSVPGQGSTFWFTLPVEKPMPVSEKLGTGPLPPLG